MIRGFLRRLLSGGRKVPAVDPVLVPLADHPLKKRVTLLCDAYVLTPTSLAEVHRACQMVEGLLPKHRALATLDEVSQAFYTNGNAVQMHDLDSVEGYSLDTLPDAVFENGEHIGYFSTKEEFPLRVSNFKSRLETQSQSDKKLNWLDANTGLSVDEANAQADDLIDDPCIVMAVPVALRYETIMAFPNGYFGSDLSPFEVYRLCQRLEAANYQLFAIGASYLAFEAVGQAGDISQILNELYVSPEIKALAKVLSKQPFLILRYTE